MHIKTYAGEYFRQVILSRFQKAINDGDYSELIPRETWIKIGYIENVTVEIEGNTLTVYEYNPSHALPLTPLYTDRIYNWGFGRFYWNNYLDFNDIPEVNINEEKENNAMTTNMPIMNLDFGPCTENIAASPYGMAVQTKDGRFLTYDAKNNKTIDITGFAFHFKNTIYKVPAAINDLRPGTMVLHQGKPMYVTNIENGIEVVDILASEAKTILPVSNMFGFDYVTTIVSFMNLNAATPTSDNPFGNLMPFMMAQMLFGENNDDPGNTAINMDMSKMMMFSMMSGQQNPFSSLFSFNNA